MSEGIHWLKGYAPNEAPIHVVNRIDAVVPASLAWTRLIDAAGWPAIYANAENVKVEGGGAELFDGARFTWKTFGVSLKSRVLEFEPETRIAWLATSMGVQAYHAWLITPTNGGCTILTEETQHGLVARAGRVLFPAGADNTR